MQEEINRAATCVREGKILLYPTDTIWGIGCDPANMNAVSRIFSIKKRNDSKALIILISDIGQLNDYVVKIPDIAWDIVEFAEKPLTVIYPLGKNVASTLLGSDGSIAIRLTQDEFCRKLIGKLGKGIVSTSANVSGAASPSCFADIVPDIKNAVDYAVDYKRKENSLPPSTIVKLELNGEIKFIRK